MTILENIILSISMVLSVIAPSKEVSYEMQTSPEYFPHVYVIPQQELALAACGCSCNVGGVYTGFEYMDGMYAMTLIMGGTPDAKIPMDNAWNSVLFHELDHHRQQLSGRMNGSDQYDEEWLMEFRQEMEQEAYMHQNGFNLMYGLPIEDVRTRTDKSTHMSEGTAECADGSTPIAYENRPRLLDLVEFYDDGMIEVYRKNYH